MRLSTPIRVLTPIRQERICSHSLMRIPPPISTLPNSNKIIIGRGIGHVTTEAGGRHFSQMYLKFFTSCCRLLLLFSGNAAATGQWTKATRGTSSTLHDFSKSSRLKFIGSKIIILEKIADDIDTDLTGYVLLQIFSFNDSHVQIV